MAHIANCKLQLRARKEQSACVKHLQLDVDLLFIVHARTENEASGTKRTRPRKVGICFWPPMQTLNFCYVPEKNRVPVVSACSLVWCCFLSYMHQLQIRREMELNGHATLKN
ncbi:unnamed protein product [Acanthoscelides obtectus]|uniref:Uncharacterized protein n=1 Tax=Acanthoscelides obtectus TaxID=200917 RepID=A0A9P0M1P1_ACAOB|nr:unnamed protein product [Acanthoscelides obtectus]CAK1619911.1 hypothetical protein AOBTE_LOCUS71 [Acanthoscelides obtectus]